MNTEEKARVDEFFNPQNGIYTRLPPERRTMLLGELTTLLLASRLHCSYRINDIGSVFLPPIHLNQFRMYRQGKRPIGFVTWARLTPETEKQYVSGTYNLHPEDWNAGDQGWIIDFIAPFGHGKQITQDLRQNIFPDEVGKAIRIDQNGKLRGIIKLHGVNRVHDPIQLDPELKLPEKPEPCVSQET